MVQYYILSGSKNIDSFSQQVKTSWGKVDMKEGQELALQELFACVKSFGTYLMRVQMAIFSDQFTTQEN